MDKTSMHYVLIHRYILLRATGCNNYAWGDANTSVICT